MKKTIAIILIASIIVGIIPINSFAIEKNTEENTIEYSARTPDDKIIEDVTAVTEGNIRTINDILAQRKFHQNTGYGFAAEQGNNLADRIKGKNARVIGDNNIKNGADRQIIGRDGTVINIQDKYYNTANASIDACFDETGFRYIDADGIPMQIEVPKDQYDKAVLRMEAKIKEGKVPGVSDPNEAKNLVRKGNLSFEQAKNLAKAGTVESLKYDAKNGIISGGGAMGISTLLNYAVLRVYGENRENALKDSAVEGVKTGIGVFCTAVIAGQLMKTGIMDVFKPSSEALTKALGEEFSKKLLKSFGQKVLAEEGKTVAETATKQAAGLLRSEVLVATVTTIVFSVPDAYDMFTGKISKKQFVKNFAVTATSIAAGAVGYGVGGFIGNLIVPGVGTIPGAFVGSLLLGAGGGFAADKIADYITEDDADEMYVILQDTYCQLCEDYLVNEQEAENVIAGFNQMLNSTINKDKMFKDMYQSDDKEKYAKDIFTPLFEKEVAIREKIDLPSEEEMRNALKIELKGVVFVH